MGISSCVRWSCAEARRHKAGLLATAGLVLAIAGPAAVAAPINYGNFSGTHVTFLQVTEDTTSGDALPLLSAPTASGNSLDFSPAGFDAHATAGGSDTTSSNLKFSVAAKSGNSLDSITFSQAGDTTLAGNTAVLSDATSSSVTAGGTITIQEVDFGAITPIVRPFSLNFSPSGGTYGLGTDGGGLSIFHTSWTGSASINLDSILTSAGVPFINGATRFSIDMDNTLLAKSELGTSARINNLDFGKVVIASSGGIVPEPGSALLGAIGVGALLLRRRKA